MSDYSFADGVTLSIAVLGAVLGIMNTWRSIDRDRVKLKVVPKQATPMSQYGIGQSTLCIDVTNFSTFPIVITEVGLLYQGTPTRGAIINPIVIDGGSFPRKLEPRTSITVYTHPDALNDHHGYMIKCAYARTDCGVMKKGNSKALEAMALEQTINR